VQGTTNVKWFVIKHIFIFNYNHNYNHKCFFNIKLFNFKNCKKTHDFFSEPLVIILLLCMQFKHARTFYKALYLVLKRFKTKLQWRISHCVLVLFNSGFQTHWLGYITEMCSPSTVYTHTHAHTRTHALLSHIFSHNNNISILYLAYRFLVLDTSVGYSPCSVLPFNE